MKKFAIAAIAAIAVGGWATDARASLLVEASTDDGATFTTVCTGTSPTGTCVNPALAIGSFIVTNEGGTSLEGSTSLELSSDTLVDNTGAAGDIWFRITATDFTMPTAPPAPAIDLHSHIGGSVAIDGAANTLAYTSCVSQTNNDNCTTTAPTLSPDVTSASYDASNNVLISSLAAPFSIVELVKFHLDAGSVLNYSSSSSLTPVPEPGSMALFGTGLFGLAGAVRRRFLKRA